jgi:phage protein D
MQNSMIHLHSAAPSKKSASGVRIGPKSITRESKPDIHVHRVNDRIESIVVTCSCGEKITIQCDYPTQA